jgi:hypothetical protein
VSKTVPVGFRTTRFWAYDVSLSILLAETVGVAQETEQGRLAPWLAGVLDRLRVQAVVGSSFALDLDLEVDDAQREQILGYVLEACRRLRRRGTVTATEAYRWNVMPDEPVIWRGADAVDTAPIADLGEAIIALIRGTLPAPPPGTWWFFGVDDGPRTIGMRPG